MMALLRAFFVHTLSCVALASGSAGPGHCHKRAEDTLQCRGRRESNAGVSLMQKTQVVGQILDVHDEGSRTTTSPLTTDSVGLSKDRLFEFTDALTSHPVSGSDAIAVHSSGGAAGGVVSEGQGYGVLIAGGVLASLDSEDSDRQRIMDLTYGYFLGWRRMCELSASDGSCQEDEGFQCGGGQYPCLAHWKFGDDLTTVIGKGAAPDGDADALAGMLLAVLAVESDSSRPAWYDEMGQWAYDTCKQFYLSATVDSATGNHRIVKLGSCWGGWDGQGQNPSYHAPGVYRMCKHYMKSHDGMFGTSATEGDGYEDEWTKVIDTTYKMFAADQCPSTGLITNWATISESADGQSLSAATGFSGSGTPGAEYGSEASRGVWRVALDYLLYPSEAGPAAASFLSPVVDHLERKESGGNWADALDIDSSCLVETIHSSWSWNMFMAGPTFSSLVCPAAPSSTRQQELIDAAGARVASTAITDYYSGSWVAITTMTFNGDLSKAALKAGLGGATAAPTPVPSTAPLSAPTPRICKGFCYKHTANWANKCTWSDCVGCQECEDSTAVPTLAPAPAPTPGCKGFCDRNTQTWDKKCTWNDCTGCQVCETLEDSTTQSPGPASDFCCSWDLSMGCQGNSYCNANEDQCTVECDGQWISVPGS